MFTGIVSGLGTVAESHPGRLGIEHEATAKRAALGASVAVNGACLTVVEVEGATFYADVVPETLKRTNLGALKPGDVVNLELPLTPVQLLDGHLVQGHIDATTEVREVRQVELGREVTIDLPGELARYVAEKGSIAVDGVSLTVVAVDDDAASFTIAYIPHTLEQTTAGGYRKGSQVNLEVDVVARYVDRLVRPGTNPGIK
ncbi:MAG: riboflavin synthase [Candidatus Dormibacteraeota bacterium]|nr:riboflavin synthase [Candidatus Dormibacteraeota bacterium]